MDKHEALEKLLNAYSHSYDVTRNAEAEGAHYPATAHYFLRDEHYLVRRDKKFYATEQHDYTYFLLADRLDAETLRLEIDRAREAGLKEIKPHKEHMCSYVTLVILADEIEPEAKKRIRRTRFQKNFRLALHGWMELHIAAMECSTLSFLSNPAGKVARRTLERNFGTK